MEVRGRDVELAVLADLGDLAQHRFAVAPPEAGIDDQRRAVADDDADVRDEADVAVGNDVGVLGQLDGGILPHERIGHWGGLRGRV